MKNYFRSSALEKWLGNAGLFPSGCPSEVISALCCPLCATCPLPQLVTLKLLVKNKNYGLPYDAALSNILGPNIIYVTHFPLVFTE